MVTLHGSAEAEPFQGGWFESEQLVRELSKRRRLAASFQRGETRAQTAGCSPRRVKATDRSSSKRGKVYSCRHTVLHCPGGMQPKEMR